MDQEKLIVILLLVAVVLSVASILITSNMSVDEITNATPTIIEQKSQAASASLIVEQNPNTGGTG